VRQQPCELARLPANAKRFQSFHEWPAHCADVRPVSRFTHPFVRGQSEAIEAVRATAACRLGAVRPDRAPRAPADLFGSRDLVGPDAALWVRGSDREVTRSWPAASPYRTG